MIWAMFENQIGVWSRQIANGVVSSLLTSVIDGDFDDHIVHLSLEYFGA